DISNSENVCVESMRLMIWTALAKSLRTCTPPASNSNIMGNMRSSNTCEIPFHYHQLRLKCFSEGWAPVRPGEGMNNRTDVNADKAVD
ncbi:2378_t:CDS:2, partial [Scutellospora calospora]